MNFYLTLLRCLNAMQVIRCRHDDGGPRRYRSKNRNEENPIQVAEIQSRKTSKKASKLDETCVNQVSPTESQFGTEEPSLHILTSWWR